MGSSRAIVVGAAVIAAALLFAFHWDVATAPGSALVVRLDRWTGAVTACSVDPQANLAAARLHTPLALDCTNP